MVKWKMLTSKEISAISIFTALSVVITFANLEYPFPPIAFLKFDLSEVPIFILALLYGPISTFISAVAVGLVIVARGDPVGAFFKILSIVSTAVPVAYFAFSGMPKIKEKKYLFGWLAGILSSFIRAIVMTVGNYILIPILYFPPGVAALAELLGLDLYTFLFLIGLFNILQGLLNFVPAFLIMLKLPPEWKPDWMME